MPASEGRLIGEAEGEIEKEDGVLVIRRIHVRLHLKAAPDHRETAERVHGFFADRCPIYRTLKAAIAISTGTRVRAEQLGTEDVRNAEQTTVA